MPRSTVSLGSFPAYCGLTSSTQSASDYFTGIYVLPQIFCVYCSLHYMSGASHDSDGEYV